MGDGRVKQDKGWKENKNKALERTVISNDTVLVLYALKKKKKKKKKILFLIKGLDILCTFNMILCHFP